MHPQSWNTMELFAVQFTYTIPSLSITMETVTTPITIATRSERSQHRLSGRPQDKHLSATHSLFDKRLTVLVFCNIYTKPRPQCHSKKTMDLQYSGNESHLY